MTDAANDNPKRSHGVVWYCGLLLSLYVISYPIYRLLALWLVKHRLSIGGQGTVLGTLYYPMDMFMFYIGLWGPFIDLLNRVGKLLP